MNLNSKPARAAVEQTINGLSIALVAQFLSVVRTYGPEQTLDSAVFQSSCFRALAALNLTRANFNAAMRLIGFADYRD
jgi:hypothetical protein